MTNAPNSSELCKYEVHAWCDRTFTSRFSVTAVSPEAALAIGREQVYHEGAEECDERYPWDTFTVEDESGALVASVKPLSPANLLQPVRELLAHIEDLGSEFSICREISRSSYMLAALAALAAQGVAI
jgi:hypothetical protein